MNKYKVLFDKKVDKYGQTAILHKFINGIRCPCYDEDTGYCDPQWHRDHPEAPECNDEGYLQGINEQIILKAFIFPANDLNKSTVDEVVLASLGQLSKDDYIYVGKSDVSIFNLKDTDYLEYDNKRWRIKNPDNYKIGDDDISFVAKLELLGDV
ncbi:hypothetical protein FQB35_10480 [Crassaminicella thermophila]|uniref:Uncharacterized protein n=1 Tax=Crassaminicella thermophila TaxID=2599308 RepID=A0A5C0SFP9_CRATE|nr:hypothetical protein [Crassaminicella thermophila]QEK12722.1 hypothetical protein FQB35_10480 [Crassaminicella thermophila]